ncbi:MAG TPA: HEAT repeat domain-containing protein [Pyrinomonadaceae bacterium]|nr:HEAT repeat domain-containing protein [Pyrinomonadaceae bacterium]
MFSATPYIATQSRIIPPQRTPNANVNARPKVTTLRASDSAEGSRVAVTADQSLSDYEAYRRGDRFYVKIPPADVPRAEAIRGRAFSDVRVQREGDSTIISFRLQPGATARVEPHGNKLDVVFTMPGAKSSSPPASGAIARSDAGRLAPVSDRKRQPERNANSSARLNVIGSSTSRNANERSLFAMTKSIPTPKPNPTPKTSPSPLPSLTAPALTSPTSKISPATVQQRSTTSPAAGGSPIQVVAQTNTWSAFKQRIRYWILLAQLNPIPVAIGAGVLLFFIGLLILQRRRARATRRARLRQPRKRVPSVPAEVTPAVPDADRIMPALVAPTAAKIAATDTAVSSAASEESAASTRRPERSERVSDELKKLMAGGDYDENILASDDRETRQLVGAELLSALVGRNLQRRERARAAFMRHGYFDDATRDLRIADSPNERAAAARRLSFAHDREATPHLTAALDDVSPDVRRAAVEALMDLRDPAAIAPLNSLMQNENDRKVPRSLIKHAIESCATGTADESTPTPSVSSVPPTTPSPVSAALETEREVIEI